MDDTVGQMDCSKQGPTLTYIDCWNVDPAALSPFTENTTASSDGTLTSENSSSATRPVLTILSASGTVDQRVDLSRCQEGDFRWKICGPLGFTHS